jgi:Peptidase family S41
MKRFGSIGLTAAIVLGSALQSHAAATDFAHSELFDAVSSTYSAVVQGKDFPYYSQAMRVQTLTDLIRSVKSDYSLVLYKEHTIGLDPTALGQAAIAVENSIPDVLTVPEQAAGNMQFLDRVKKLVANFQDSHFSIEGAQPVAIVVLGVGIAEADGKYIISSLRTPLLKDQTTGVDFSTQVSLGDEVVSIDGQAPQDAAAALKPYISGSSDLFRATAATSDLTLRNFQFPAAGTSQIVIRHGSSTTSVALPWYSLMVQRSDEAQYLQTAKVTLITSENAVAVFGKDAVASGDITSAFKNENWSTTIQGLAQEKDFTDASNPTSIVVRTGVLTGKSGKVAYLQVQSFNVATLTDGPAPTGLLSVIREGFMETSRAVRPRPARPAEIQPDPADGPSTNIYQFTQVMKAFVAGAKAGNLPLLLDLRNNPGGNLDYATGLFADLIGADKTYAPLSNMFRITELSWESEDAMSTKGVTDPTAIATQAKIDAVFKDAVAAGRDYSEILPDDMMTADADVSGYSGKVVELTSPNCVSACDAFSLLMKSSGRGKILGQPTNGTGAGFFSTFTVNDWTDTNHLVTARIPNMLFGRPLKAGETDATANIESVEAENRPTQPDVIYSTSVNDVLSGNSDLIAAALKQF